MPNTYLNIIFSDITGLLSHRIKQKNIFLLSHLTIMATQNPYNENKMYLNKTHQLDILLFKNLIGYQVSASGPLVSIERLANTIL